MNEWMNEWMKEWMKKGMNEWMFNDTPASSKEGKESNILFYSKLFNYG